MVLMFKSLKLENRATESIDNQLVTYEPVCKFIRKGHRKITMVAELARQLAQEYSRSFEAENLRSMSNL